MEPIRVVKSSACLLTYLVRLRSGETIDAAKWTLKTSDADADGAALLLLSVTTSGTAAGQVTDQGSDGTAEIRITLTEAQTGAVGATSALSVLKVRVQPSARWVEVLETRRPVTILPSRLQSTT